MPSTRTLAIAAVWLALASSLALSGEGPPEALQRLPAPSRDRPASKTSSSGSGPGWWLGPAGIAAALAVFGGVSLASKRFVPSRDSGPMQVVGRSSLSTKHSACLLRVGDRVLIVGFGPQGAPSTLGEVTDPVELARLAPRRPLSVPTVGLKVVTPRPSTGFDQRIGDDE